MTRLALATRLALVGLAGALAAPACGERKDRQSPDQLRAEIAALEKERGPAAAEARPAGRQGPPHRRDAEDARARRRSRRRSPATWSSASRAASSTTSRSSSRTSRSTRRGRSRRSSRSGSTSCTSLIKRVSGRLKTGKPSVTFGGNRVELAMPVTVASGTGNATIDFKWDGKGVSDAVCGDMEIPGTSRAG